VAPIPASSARTTRHRLHRGGDRDANRALWAIALGRLRWEARTRAYVAKRTAEAKTELEIIRRITRYLARERHHVLTPRRPGRQPGRAERLMAERLLDSRTASRGAALPAGLACRPAKPHACAVKNLRALPTRREVFIDQRGAGLRATWHPERDLLVLSVWHIDRCVGTFRMSVQDVPRLSALLTAALGDWITQVSSTPQQTPREATGLSITQRLRLSRAALRLRRLRHRRKRSA
jgi:hypothetical protein